MNRNFFQKIQKGSALPVALGIIFITGILLSILFSLNTQSRKSSERNIHQQIARIYAKTGCELAVFKMVSTRPIFFSYLNSKLTDHNPPFEIKEFFFDINGSQFSYPEHNSFSIISCKIIQYQTGKSLTFILECQGNYRNQKIIESITQSIDFQRKL